MYIQPKVEEMVLPQDPFMLGEGSVPITTDPQISGGIGGGAPERGTKVY